MAVRPGAVVKNVSRPAARYTDPPMVKIVVWTVAGAALAAGAVLAYGAFLVARDERAAKEKAAAG